VLRAWGGNIATHHRAIASGGAHCRQRRRDPRRFGQVQRVGIVDESQFVNAIVERAWAAEQFGQRRAGIAKIRTRRRTVLQKTYEIAARKAGEYNFIDAILGRAEPKTSPGNGIVQSELMDAIYESARTGKLASRCAWQQARRTWAKNAH
jgi:hypothetical protein